MLDRHLLATEAARAELAGASRLSAPKDLD
jgi:hypothetical protein